VNSDQCHEVVNDLNSRKGAAFQVTRADNGNLQVVNADKVDVSKLSSGEAALFNAIQTDTTHTARLDVVPQSDTIQFGRFEGAGLNTIDASDLHLLAGADPQAAGETVAHEALEAYHSLNAGIEMNKDANHDWANQYFGDVNEEAHNFVIRTGGQPDYYTDTWNFQRIGSRIEFKTIVTQPTNPQGLAFTPGNIVEVRHLP
jgi:hypothetical protein